MNWESHNDEDLNSKEILILMKRGQLRVTSKGAYSTVDDQR